MNSNSNDKDFEQQQLSQQANSEVTELEALRRELRELKEEIKNKQQITSSDIATGVAGGIMNVIGNLILFSLGLVFIVLLGSVVIYAVKDNSSDSSISSPLNK